MYYRLKCILHIIDICFSSFHVQDFMSVHHIHDRVIYFKDLQIYVAVIMYSHLS